MRWLYSPNQQATQQDVTDGYCPSQPSQKYPWTPPKVKRVDNINQPWYGGSRSGMQAPLDVGQDITQQASGQAVFKVGDIWRNLNSWFGGNTPKQNLTDTTQANYQMGSDSLPGGFGLPCVDCKNAQGGSNSAP